MVSPVLIVVVIVVAVVVYYFVTHPSSGNSDNNTNTSTKRSIVSFAGERPVSAVYAQSKIVEGLKFREADAAFAPLSKFAGAARSIAGRYVMPGRSFEQVSETAVRMIQTLPVPVTESFKSPE